MSLLSKEKRKKYFEYLGLGEYNKENIKKFQRKAFPKLPKEQDGVYGEKTDNALRHFYNVKKYAPSFKPEEFKCDCGGKYCTGYPTYMRRVELKHLQRIRDHYDKPMTITSGLRCKKRNSELGGIGGSLHTKGRAADFYMKGVTDTLANRKAAIKWIKKQPNHDYTYGNGIDSRGKKRSAPKMGNALHTDTNPEPKKKVELTTTLTYTKTTTSKAKQIVAKAKELCWAKDTPIKKWRYKTGHARTVYKAALKKFMHKKAKISQSDCGYCVSTITMAAKICKDFNILHQWGKAPKGLKIVHSGKKVPEGFFKPGDLVRFKKKGGGQHAYMIINSKTIAEAGRGHWFPRIRSGRVYQCNSDKIRRSTVQVLRAK